MNTTQNIVAKRITIQDIELRTEKRRKFPIARQLYVEFSVGDTLRSTESAKETKNRTSWDKPLYFDGDDRSVLLVRVYEKYPIGNPKLVGSFSDTIGYVLGILKDGVLETSLRKDTLDGPDRSGIAIKLTFAAEPHEETNADERQATDAVTLTEPTVSSHDPPAIVDTLVPVVDVDTGIMPTVQTHEITSEVLLRRMEIFNRIVDDIAEIRPYASLAWSIISAASKVLLAQKNCDDRIIHLAGVVNDVFMFVEDLEPLKRIGAHVKTITLLLQQVTECGYFIIEYPKANLRIRTAKYKMFNIDARITDYEIKLQEFKTALMEGVSVQTEITVIRMMDDVEHAVEAIDLFDMPYAQEARYVPEKGCLSGTRESFLAEICDIFDNVDEGAPQVCLLTGVAGSGKSAVAHSIARLYDGRKRLGSSYCFARSNASRGPENLFSTIARDLSDLDPQYKSVLRGVLKENRALRTSTSPFEQLEKLVIEPTQRLHPVGPLVIVIDAIDESGDEAIRRELLRAISNHISNNNLPTNLRFLITARPEGDILAALRPGRHVVRKQMSDIPDNVVDGDIYQFIRYSLHHYTELESSWPDEEWCRLLVRHSHHLFQWASTACSFVKGFGIGLNPPKRLEILLQNNSTNGVSPLDELYRRILWQLFASERSQRWFRDVMTVILALKEPLPLSSLSTLFSGYLKIRAIIPVLASLLDGVLDEQRPIQPLHTSFRDFLLDEARSLAFHIRILPEDSLLLGRTLLLCMRNMLRFNICDLKDSRDRNSDIPDLPSRANRAIPPHLSYSCQCWMYHLQYVEHSPALVDEVTTFFKDFFPYWLEAISLLSLLSPLSSIPSALETCTILNNWAKGQEIATLASEAYLFIQVFAPVLRESTPHLYLSAIPQTPSGSPLCKLWVEHLRKHVLATWPAEVHTLQGHADPVTSIVCLPGGRHVTPGSEDKTIRVWNATTNQSVAGPFEGHTDFVRSVAYSPDGRHISSGSDDRTIRIWEATTGQCVAGPFQGHKDQVKSVAYSPDGRHIVSGSDDKTIMIWDATTGQCVAGPFQGHMSTVFSVAYSPDGRHIVSGSWDNTIRVWNATQCVAGPFKGHTDYVRSVAYSPDGRHIVSGSDDKTIRIWDATTGQCVAGPFQGHKDWVRSVAYSPDGRYIASGSDDGTIMIWDTTGQCVAGPSQEDTYGVFSVAYSPDGRHIVSGSWGAIRIWNATTGKCVAGPFKGHTDYVRSVAYSPNGVHIVSGSNDKTIRIWNAVIGHADHVRSVVYSPDGRHIASGSGDGTTRVWNATTGQCVAGPFQGHTGFVFSVAYSPDGKYITSGSEDRTVRVWNVTTCKCVAGPFEGHVHYIRSVAYSSDGRHIVSGSEDKTIRVWNATTGQCVAGPFKGHTDCITSVAYSPSGKHIVSGSEDKSIRVWNATTGQCVAGPFQGHTGIVFSVAYSPSGGEIVSGSEDKTIRVWNTITGQCVGSPFEGHTCHVTSVAYSPDGRYIVSGSWDKTIRLWDATTGQCVAGPFQGHTHIVTSVSFSPDGLHIVSGSNDFSIKVWKTDALLSLGNLHTENGSIQSSGGSYFGWVAPWSRPAFCLPAHSLVISSTYAYQHDVDLSLYGELWTSSWK